MTSVNTSVLACAESNFSRISPGKRTFKQNHFSLFFRGPDGFDSWNKKDNKSCDTAPLNKQVNINNEVVKVSTEELYSVYCDVTFLYLLFILCDNIMARKKSKGTRNAPKKSVPNKINLLTFYPCKIII